MPLPGDWENIFYPIQFFESILLIFLYVWLTLKNRLYKNREFVFLTSSLIISLSVYSLLAFNEGTFVRYRFTLFFPFLIAVFYLVFGKNSLIDNSDDVDFK